MKGNQGAHPLVADTDANDILRSTIQVDSPSHLANRGGHDPTQLRNRTADLTGSNTTTKDDDEYPGPTACPTQEGTHTARNAPATRTGQLETGSAPQTDPRSETSVRDVITPSTADITQLATPTPLHHYDTKLTNVEHIDDALQPTAQEVPDELPDFLSRINYPTAPGEISTPDPIQEIPGTLAIDVKPEDENDQVPYATPLLQFNKWPFPNPRMHMNTAFIYDTVKSTGCHNHEQARITLPSSLNIEEWRREATGHEMDQTVLQGIQFGFPIQYCGPPQYTAGTHQNHPSAENHKNHLYKYTQEELAHHAIEGPFSEPPFTPWCVTSPMMTREKTDSLDRRIIVDLSYPDGGINEYIIPHVFNGKPATHNLPTIEAAVNTISRTCPGQTTLAVIDLSRAYRQFPVCPLDWPLLGIKVDKSYYFDRRLPFGARMSAFTMQIVADFLVRSLAKRKINAHMYLDDIILVCQNPQLAQKQYQETLQLIKSLGLQVASKKLQPPSQKVRWLGIDFDTDKGLLSIPPSKLAEIQRCMAAAAKRESVTKKQLQRIIGSVNHLAKVVRAARLFIGRILAAYRATQGEQVRVSAQVKADCRWFARYLAAANGRAIIPSNRVVLRIWADACPTGAGAAGDTSYYVYKFPDRTRNQHHIAHLEALNCVAAVRTFITPAHAGGTVEVFCDNRPAIDSFRSGRAKDPVLAACSRAIWFKAAETDVTIVFTHVPGEAMSLPDALSRVYCGAEHRELANKLVRALGLRQDRATPDVFSYAAFL